jgi:hypothetical protein
MQSLVWEVGSDAEYCVGGRKRCRVLCGRQEGMQRIVWEEGRDAEDCVGGRKGGRGLCGRKEGRHILRFYAYCGFFNLYPPGRRLEDGIFLKT